METYDILMLIVLVAATVFGAIKGLAWQLASIASITVSYAAAYHFREPFSQSINADPPWNRFLAMLILYVGTSLVIWVVFRMVSSTIDRLKLKEFDRQVGAAFGLAKGALYCILITLFAVTLMGPSGREKIVQSRSGFYIARVLDRSDAIMPPELHEVVGPYIERFDSQMRAGAAGDDDSPSLPWTAPWAGDGEAPWSAGAQPGPMLPDDYWQEGSGATAPVDPRRWMPRDLLQQAQQPTATQPR